MAICVGTAALGCPGALANPMITSHQRSFAPPDSRGRLSLHMHDIFKQRTERLAFVKGDDNVDFEYVADVIDIARDAGVDRVGLLGKE